MSAPHLAPYSSAPGGPVARVVDAARAYYGPDERRECEIQTLLWQGRGRGLVHRYLGDLGMGILRDPYPLQVGLLRHVVDQLSVVYRSPPTRYLLDGRMRVGDADTAQTIVWEQYDRAHVDAVLREVDARRTLWRTAFVRVYASDVAQRVKLAIYPPTAVYRECDAGEPDDLRADRRIAIQRSDGTWELLEPADGGWRVTYHSARGTQDPVEERHEVLPLVPFWDGLPDQPYLPCYQWRTEYLMKIAMISNELPASVMYNVHPRLVLERGFPPPGQPQEGSSSDPPTNVGPGTLAMLEEGETMRAIELNPKIEAITRAVAETVREWYRAESLPTDDFRASQSVSGLGLRVLAEPLRERRERLAPFARESEERLFEAFRAVHNEHADAWGQPFLADGRGLDVQLGSIDVPVDPREHLEVLAREMALGINSRLGALMAYRGLARSDALAELLQVELDREAFRAEEPEQTGQRLADEETPQDGASMVQIARRAME